MKIYFMLCIVHALQNEVAKGRNANRSVVRSQGEMVSVVFSARL